jgi:L-ascorbate metabolism protein UlaG (beta-lactamase superfamily)
MMRLNIKYVLASSGILVLSGIALARSAAFGHLPTAKKMEEYKKSPHFNAAKGVFVNRRFEAIDAMRKRTMTVFNTLKHLLNVSEDVKPKTPLPTVTPDFEAFAQSTEDLKVIWLGHSSILLNIEGQKVLIDPVLAPRVGPLGFMMKRFQKTVVPPGDLPPIDLVLITHDHYDHLDMATIKAFQKTGTRFIVPLGVSAHLMHWGIPEARIQELDWWQSARFEGLEIIATPAQHFSGRHMVKQTRSLWASWVIKGAKQRVYFSGDSGYDVHFQEIGKAFGPFDLAFIESGQYSTLWPDMHLHPAQSLQAFKDLNARWYFPIHWGMFRLSMHAWYEPITIISAEAQKQQISLVTPRMGETATINKDYRMSPWWEPLIGA